LLNSLPVKRLKDLLSDASIRDPPSTTLLPAPFYFDVPLPLPRSVARPRQYGWVVPLMSLLTNQILLRYSPGDIGFDLKPTDPEELLAVQTKLRTDVLPCLPPLVS
jgi:hypothetical protein